MVGATGSGGDAQHSTATRRNGRTGLHVWVARTARLTGHCGAPWNQEDGDE